MTVFFKEAKKFRWEIQTVVTKNLGPFLEVCSHNEKGTTTLYCHFIHVLFYISENEHRQTF